MAAEAAAEATLRVMMGRVVAAAEVPAVPMLMLPAGEMGPGKLVVKEGWMQVMKLSPILVVMEDTGCRGEMEIIRHP
jgi:hypothetical protein